METHRGEDKEGYDIVECGKISIEKEDNKAFLPCKSIIAIENVRKLNTTHPKAGNFYGSVEAFSLWSIMDKAENIFF